MHYSLKKTSHQLKNKLKTLNFKKDLSEALII